MEVSAAAMSSGRSSLTMRVVALWKSTVVCTRIVRFSCPRCAAAEWGTCVSWQICLASPNKKNIRLPAKNPLSQDKKPLWLKPTKYCYTWPSNLCFSCQKKHCVSYQKIILSPTKKSLCSLRKILLSPGKKKTCVSWQRKSLCLLTKKNFASAENSLVSPDKKPCASWQRSLGSPN